MLSNHLRFGLPLLLFPGTSIPITLFPTYSSSLLETCPYHFNLLSCTFLDISPTFVVPLILSFLILYILVTPLIHLNILISATSNFFSCAFFTAHVSAPLLVLQLSCILSPWLSNLFFGRTESPISSSSFSILIVFYASSTKMSLLLMCTVMLIGRNITIQQKNNSCDSFAFLHSKRYHISHNKRLKWLVLYWLLRLILYQHELAIKTLIALSVCLSVCLSVIFACARTLDGSIVTAW